jgi:hypothetical protein
MDDLVLLPPLQQRPAHHGKPKQQAIALGFIPNSLARKINAKSKCLGLPF